MLPGTLVGSTQGSIHGGRKDRAGAGLGRVQEAKGTPKISITPYIVYTSIHTYVHIYTRKIKKKKQQQLEEVSYRQLVV